jgi:hypothetical protein
LISIYSEQSINIYWEKVHQSNIIVCKLVIVSFS